MSTGDNGVALIECRDVSVRFGGVEALSHLNLTVWQGEILGIAGPNGAGKTTLFNTISGHVQPRSGSVLLDGRPIGGMRPDRIFQLGIARTFQIPELIGTQSVHTNILVGAHFAHDTNVGAAVAFGGRSYDAAYDALVAYGLAEHRDKLAGSASLYEKKMIMIASAMAHTPRALLLDEPVGGLSTNEAQSILDIIVRVRERGTTVVIVEHVMRVLMAISDRLAILNRGTLLFEGRPEEVRENEDVQRLYLGSSFRRSRT